MLQIFFTALVTIVGGAITLALGQMAVRGAVEPVLELKRLIGNIAFDLDFYANKLFAGSPAEDEWRTAFRKHACSLREKLILILWYRFFAWLLRLPPAYDVLKASYELTGHSNRSTRPGENEGGREDEIKRLLRIKSDTKASVNTRSGTRRFVLVVSILVGFICVWVIPPPLYFQLHKLTAGLPQQYFAFDPDRYLAGVPQRSGLEIATITTAKFFVGLGFIWLIYLLVAFVRRGFTRTTT